MLYIAADRQDLVDDAVVALNGEIQKRGLSAVQLQQARRIKRGVQVARARDTSGAIGVASAVLIPGGRLLRRRSQRRSQRDESGDFISPYWALLICPAVILLYAALVPEKLKIGAEWVEPALVALVGTTIVALPCRPLWNRFSFWLALAVSTATQTYLAYTWLIKQSSSKGIWTEFCIVAGFFAGATVFGLCSWFERRWRKDKQSSKSD